MKKEKLTENIADALRAVLAEEPRGTETATLTFDLTDMDSKSNFAMASKYIEMGVLIDDYLHHLRNLIKHNPGQLPGDTVDGLEMARDIFVTCLDELGFKD